MTASNVGRCGWRICLLGLGLISLLGLTGCQIDVGGQTLPSPWYLNDDVQYFPPGQPDAAHQGSGGPKGRVAGTDAATLAARRTIYCRVPRGNVATQPCRWGRRGRRAADPQRRGDGTLRGWRPGPKIPGDRAVGTSAAQAIFSRMGLAMPELSPFAQTWLNVVLIWIGFGSLAGLLARAILPLAEPAGSLPTLTLGHHRQCDRSGVALLDSGRRPLESHQSGRILGGRGWGFRAVAGLSLPPSCRASHTADRGRRGRGSTGS